MNFASELQNLRNTYRTLQPGQRLRIAGERIKKPVSGAAELVTRVSAIEGALRSLVIWQESGDRPSKETYDRYKYMGVADLLDAYITQVGAERKELVDDDCYELVEYSVGFRNLIVHECTFLGSDKYPSLIEACDRLLESLRQHASQRWRIT